MLLDRACILWSMGYVSFSAVVVISFQHLFLSGLFSSLLLKEWMCILLCLQLPVCCLALGPVLGVRVPCHQSLSLFLTTVASYCHFHCSTSASPLASVRA